MAFLITDSRGWTQWNGYWWPTKEAIVDISGLLNGSVDGEPYKEIAVTALENWFTYCNPDADFSLSYTDPPNICSYDTYDSRNCTAWANLGKCSGGTFTLGETTIRRRNVNDLLEVDVALNSQCISSGYWTSTRVMGVLSHEYGHLLGLDHSSVSGALMRSTFDEAVWHPEADDCAGFYQIYCLPDLFNYATPGDGTRNQPLHVDLDWNDSSGATSYDVYFGTTYPPPFLINKASSYHDPGTLNDDTNYYWMIVAKNSCGDTPGPIWSFTTLCQIPTVPILISPSNGATVPLNPTLDWSDVSKATSYDVQVCSDSGCSSVVRSQSGLVASQWTVSPVLSNGTLYYWRVRAKSACGPSSWTSTWSFTTSTIVLQSPANGQVFDSCSLVTNYQPSFEWTVTGTFTKYTILFSTSPLDFTSPIARASISAPKNSWIPTSWTWKKIMSSSYNNGTNRNIYWKVIGTMPDRTTIESEAGARSFLIGPSQTVTINAPLDGTVFSSSTPSPFNFNSNCNVKFLLQFSSVDNFLDTTKIRGFTFTTRDPNIETILNRNLNSWQWTSVKKLVGPGTGYFRIKAWDGINRETFSEVRDFTINYLE